MDSAGTQLRPGTPPGAPPRWRRPQPRAADPSLPAASVAALTQWLRSQDVEVSGRPEVQRCTGGMSHLTYRLRYDTHDFILRRPLQAQGGVQRMRREFLLQSALRPHYAVADMVRLCVDPGIFGTPFYLMSYVTGIVPRRKTFASFALPAAAARQVCVNMLDQMIALHRIDPRSLASKELALVPATAMHVRRLLVHWLDRHLRLKTWNMADLRSVGQWLIDHVPQRSGVALLHNDWRLDNIVFDTAQPSRVRAVLDWEFAGMGDPLMDLGILLSYWVEASDSALVRHYQWQPSHLPGMFRRDELLEHYVRATGREPRDWPFYRLFGLFRYLVNLQELYVRHALQAGEERALFKGVWVLIHYLHWKCLRLMRHA